MEPDFYNADGKRASADELRIEKARDLAHKMLEGRIAFANFVECTKNTISETVVFDVDVEAAQIRQHPILPTERISATFYETDNFPPKVCALRKDFPLVPHLNLHIQEFPRNLCLYDKRYEEIKYRWTSAIFVNRIREWLALTASGELHQEDQPLEQVLVDHVGHLVLPLDVMETDRIAQPLLVGSIAPVKNGKLFLISRVQSSHGREHDFIASVHLCPPQNHGTIHRRPSTLAELAGLVSETGLDLLADLRKRLLTWQSDDEAFLESRILLIIQFPKRRKDGGEVETAETWAFILAAAKEGKPAGDLSFRELGIRIGIWEMKDSHVGALIIPDSSKNGEDVCLDVLNVSFDLDRTMAAWLNGNTAVEDIGIVAVGAGALGSQVIMNLSRGSFGNWTIIDHDRLMPHNIARHSLIGHYIGCFKADAIAFAANTIVNESKCFSSLSADVLSPGEKEDDVATACSEAEIILDMSTSIAVARKLACDVESDARRISLFMTPSGLDLVFLAEDKNRQTTLDTLEMQYYRAVANEESLAQHFHPSARKRRYGRSCRDITSTLPQNRVAMHAAIGAQAIQNGIADPGAIATIWRADDSGNVQRVDVKLSRVIRARTRSWNVVTDEGLIEKLAAFREEKLPDETGGVLLGSFDLERMILYIVDALPSPPDSEEWPTLYIRGCEGQRRAVETLEKKTHGMLEYIGEWHSHPRGADTAVSADDLKVFDWLKELMTADGLPATMMIAGDNGRTSYYVGEIMQEENLLTGTSNHE